LNMINTKKIQTHAFLWYKDTHEYILTKLAKAGITHLNLSLESGNKNNKTIITAAKKLIPNVRYIKVRPCGSDQLGFYCSAIKYNKTKKDWILYCHDKSKTKQKWVDSILDPILQDKINDIIVDNNIGIISSGHPDYFKQLWSEEDLVKLDHQTFFHDKKCIVECRHTLTWLRELQYILFRKHGLMDKENLNFNFTAGNMFLIRRDVLQVAHSCIHSNFFPNNYRADGDVSHALERFYYYVSICMKYKNEFI